MIFLFFEELIKISCTYSFCSVMGKIWLNSLGIASLNSKVTTCRCKQPREAKHHFLLRWREFRWLVILSLVTRIRWGVNESSSLCTIRDLILPLESSLQTLFPSYIFELLQILFFDRAQLFPNTILSYFLNILFGRTWWKFRWLLVQGFTLHCNKGVVSLLYSN